MVSTNGIKETTIAIELFLLFLGRLMALCFYLGTTIRSKFGTLPYVIHSAIALHHICLITILQVGRVYLHGAGEHGHRDNVMVGEWTWYVISCELSTA